MRCILCKIFKFISLYNEMILNIGYNNHDVEYWDKFHV
ncbi:hypothetical protein CLCAR_1848 [Clostridium carboxidivorans P7]|nr:hypothetical protein CLCAR_1848 [Clostridium carboxidivorans P7]